MLYQDLFLLAAIAALFYLLLVRPAKQRRAQQAALIDSLAPGRRIMTTAGLFGTVVAIDDERVHVEVAPGVVVEMLPQAIAKTVDEPTPPVEPTAATELPGQAPTLSQEAMPQAGIDEEAPRG